MAFIYELQSESHLQVFEYTGIGRSSGIDDSDGDPTHIQAKSGCDSFILLYTQWTVAFYLNKHLIMYLMNLKKLKL